MAQRSSFYVGIAGAVVLITFVGFAPTYYLRALFDAPTLSALHHVHGLAATFFVLALLVQAILVFAGKTSLHKQVGRLAAAAAAVTAVTMGTLAVRVVGVVAQVPSLAASPQRLHLALVA